MEVLLEISTILLLEKCSAIQPKLTQKMDAKMMSKSSSAFVTPISNTLEQVNSFQQISYIYIFTWHLLEIYKLIT